MWIPDKTLPMEELFRNRQTVVMLMVLGILVAPFIEETLFRGCLYPVIAGSFGIPAGIVVTGIVFGLAHAPQLWGGWGQIALLMGVGMVLTYIRARAGTVAASYFVHVSYNSILFAGLFFATGGLRHFPPPERRAESIASWFAEIAAIRSNGTRISGWSVDSKGEDSLARRTTHRVDPEGVVMIDQRRLPGELVRHTYTDYRDVAKAIRDMVIRGAPAIGVAAAMGVALGVLRSEAASASQLRAEFPAICETIRRTRPTAVDLFWALERMKRRFDALPADS